MDCPYYNTICHRKGGIHCAICPCELGEVIKQSELSQEKIKGLEAHLNTFKVVDLTKQST